MSVMYTLLSDVQPENAEEPIEITLLGIVMLSREVQSENAEEYIEVKADPFSKDTFVIFVLPENSELKYVTLLGITSSVTLSKIHTICVTALL